MTFVDKLGATRSPTWRRCAAYREAAARKSDFERTELSEGEDRRASCKGIKAINPVERAADPDFHLRLCAGDLWHGRHHGRARRTTQRDWEFAKKFGLPIVEVVAGGDDVQKEAFADVRRPA